MTRLIAAGAVAALFLIAVDAATAKPSITGTYQAIGKNPTDGGQYKGTVTIKKEGKTYHLTWNVGESEYMGSGLLRDNYLAIAYTNSKGSWFGVIMYKVLQGGKLLDGKWAVAGGKNIGSERLIRKAGP